MRLLDFGDYNPFHGKMRTTALVAYDGNDDEVDRDEIFFTSDGTINLHSGSAGDLWYTGDAVSAGPGDPGNRVFTVTGTGIVRVEFQFSYKYGVEDPEAVVGNSDPNTALQDLCLPEEAPIRRVTYCLAGQLIAMRVSGHPEADNNGLFFHHSDYPLAGAAAFWYRRWQDSNWGNLVKAVRQRVQGTLLMGNGRTALLLKDAWPAAATAEMLYLRYAFVTQGVESHILPAFVLDDWGKEIKSLELYEWVREYGDQFPRAEVFGFDLSGKATQVFLRELELVSKLPCYAYPTKETPLAAGALIEAILLPDVGVTTAQKTKRPPAMEVGQPLRSARVSWWRVNPSVTSFDFALLE